MRKYLLLMFTLLLLPYLTSCALTTPQAFYEEAPKEWTHRQKITAFFYALQKEATVQTPTGRDINRELVSITNALYLTQRLLADLNWFVSNEEFIDYLMWNGSKQSIRETQARWEFLFKCLQAYKIQGELAQNLGIVLKDKLLTTKNYSIDLILACPQLSEKLKLLDPRVEETLVTGRLIPNQIISLEIADPLGMVKLTAKTYILQPDQAQTQEEALAKYYSPGIYAEIYREEEEFPIIRLYRPSGAQTLTLALIDKDPPDVFGYQLPDELSSVSVSNALEYISSNIKSLIPREEQPFYVFSKKQRPDVKEIYIVKSGEQTIQVWEEGTFEVPIDYKNGNFLVDVQYKKVKEPRPDGLKEVEFYIEKYYESNVIEFYVPKKEFSLVLSVVPNENSLIVKFKDKPSVDGPPKSLGVLTFVVYREDEKSWMLWDSDGDGIFDKRRLVMWNW